LAGVATGRASDASPTTIDPRLLVLYDRDCAFCAWTARQLWTLDRHRRLAVLPLQDAAASQRPGVAAAVAGSPLHEALHVVDERDGLVVAGGDALLLVLDVLPGGRWFRPWVALPFIPPLASAVYRVAARNRHRIGRWLGLDASRCVVPAGRPIG
jgi:predicted DCC family thiol-disulfide oxidoreductase YuxK